MRLADSLELSINSILHRKLRSWLTLLGIIIGVAAVVSIISIGEGAQQNVTQRLAGLGADIITITPGFSRTGSFGGSFRGGRPFGGPDERLGSASSETPTLTKRDAAIIAANPNVLQVNEIVSGRGELVFLAEKLSAGIRGVNPNTWRGTSNLELASGRWLTMSDSAAIVVGDRIANSTFRRPLTLGTKVAIEGLPFTVIGIVKAGNADSTVFMPHSSAWTVTDINKDVFSSIEAKIADAALVETATAEITQALMISRRVTEKNQDFTVTSAQAMQERISEVTQTLTLFLGSIAAVSLLVGAIGIANSMFTSVLEKTREIGILKALGSTNYEILRLFIIESGLFGLAGGLIGVAVGTLVSFGISALGMRMMGLGAEVQTVVTPQLVIAAVVLSTIIGVVSGIMPARAASALKPVEALRYE